MVARRCNLQRFRCPPFDGYWPALARFSFFLPAQVEEAFREAVLVGFIPEGERLCGKILERRTLTRMPLCRRFSASASLLIL